MQTLEWNLDTARVPPTGFSAIEIGLPEDVAARIKSAEDIGLHGLAHQEKEEILIPLLRMERLRMAQEKLGLAPLSAFDYGIWAVFLPTSYYSLQGACPAAHVIRQGLWDRHSHYYNLAAREEDSFGYNDPWPGQNSHHWANYIYEDGMPDDVRLLVSRIMPLFDAFEIRTMESHRSSDPALFGWIGKIVFLIARWGSADAKLFSFEEIRDVILPACDEARIVHMNTFLLRGRAAKKAALEKIKAHPHLRAPVKAILCDRLRLVSEEGW